LTLDFSGDRLRVAGDVPEFTTVAAVICEDYTAAQPPPVLRR
jgi:hypothetical protein